MTMTTMPPTAPPTAPDDTGIPDFSESNEPRRFRVDPDVFEAHGNISADTLMAIGQIGDTVDDKPPAEKVEALALMFTIMLLPSSAGRFVARLRAKPPSDDNPDPLPPISLKQANDISEYLIEIYAGRPTEQPGDSSPG